MSNLQLTWDNYDSKFCIIDDTKVCYKEVCHESYGVDCCLSCKKCNAWFSCPIEAKNPPRVNMEGVKCLSELPDRYMCLCMYHDGTTAEVKMIWANYWQDECGWRVGPKRSGNKYAKVIEWRLCNDL